jgi:hypothetical protein
MLAGKQAPESRELSERQANDPLELWADEAIRRCRAAGYHGVFEEMRGRHGTDGAMARLVRSADIQSGFFRCMLREWTIEAGILRFPDRFTVEEREAAQFRLDHVDDPMLRAR